MAKISFDDSKTKGKRCKDMPVIGIYLFVVGI